MEAFSDLDLPFVVNEPRDKEITAKKENPSAFEWDDAYLIRSFHIGCLQSLRRGKLVDQEEEDTQGLGGWKFPKVMVSQGEDRDGGVENKDKSAPHGFAAAVCLVSPSVDKSLPPVPDTTKGVAGPWAPALSTYNGTIRDDQGNSGGSGNSDDNIDDGWEPSLLCPHLPMWATEVEDARRRGDLLQSCLIQIKDSAL
uniref:Uncharacterized protein n=1 Tax=Corethron hystrix TaxID=216773 RepID=A0A7S1BJH4_9STRA|mmetsp:Transcript_29657/g.68090  ORF Transcript_29657/g.68090 Transcript_29657/m.68090 type:complete len:197 (+) Transcript_29657:312-902(+)